MTRVSNSKARKAAIKYGYRSGLEKDTAAFLRHNKVKFTYEEEKISWDDFKVRSYTPDFILANGIIIETKGRFVTADRRKHKMIKKQYGDEYDIRFLFSNPNAKINKGSKTTYGKWCEQNGFLYSKGPDVPKEWMEE